MKPQEREQYTPAPPEIENRIKFYFRFRYSYTWTFLSFKEHFNEKWKTRENETSKQRE